MATQVTYFYILLLQVTFLCPMQFDAFPFDMHDCIFRVQSLETPDTALKFRYQPETAGIIWKTQTILEHRVTFKKLEEVIMRWIIRIIFSNMSMCQAWVDGKT
jgi:hypothetical protein